MVTGVRKCPGRVDDLVVAWTKSRFLISAVEGGGVPTIASLQEYMKNDLTVHTNRMAESGPRPSDLTI